MRWELYELDAEPNELTNVYGTRENGDLVVDLKARLESLKEKYEAI